MMCEVPISLLTRLAFSEKLQSMTDEQLLGILDDPNHAWLVRGGGVWPAGSLRQALMITCGLIGQGQVVTYLARMPHDNIAVRRDQIDRLLSSLGVKQQ